MVKIEAVHWRADGKRQGIQVLKLPTILAGENVEAAAALLGRYYSVTPEGVGRVYTGSHFDGWAGGGDGANVRNRFTDHDFVAVTMLAVDLPAGAAIGLSNQEKAAEITRLLEEIPHDKDLAALSAEEATQFVGPGSPAGELWKIVRSREAPWGVGPTIASKLLARKRPRLLPIWDTVIGQVVGRESPDDQWLEWHTLLADGTGLPERLELIHRLSSAPSGLSQLRIMDVVLWMHGKDRGYYGGEVTKAAGGFLSQLQGHNDQSSSRETGGVELALRRDRCVGREPA